MSGMRKVRESMPLLLIAIPVAAFGAAEGEESLILKPVQGPAQTAQKTMQIEELRDIHGPIPMAGPPPYRALGLAVGILLAILAAYLYLKKKRKPAKIASPTPWETALTELAAAKELQNQALLYMERVSEILRRYIESRFSIRSTRQTTREFLEGLSRAGEHNPLAPFQTELQACLEQADLAKFAHLIPGPDNVAEIERAVGEFVKKTEPPPIEGRGGKP